MTLKPGDLVWMNGRTEIGMVLSGHAYAYEILLSDGTTGTRGWYELLLFSAAPSTRG